MDKLKETLGMKPESQSGTEPVSGEMGEGTSTEPFDQGNAAGESILIHPPPPTFRSRDTVGK